LHLAAQAVPPIATHFFMSVCRLSHSCPCLNRLTDLDAIWQVNLWGPMTHCVRLGFWPLRGRGDFGGRTRTRNVQLLPTYERVDLWFTRWQPRSAIPPLTKLLWFLFTFIPVMCLLSCCDYSYSSKRCSWLFIFLALWGHAHGYSYRQWMFV